MTAVPRKRRTDPQNLKGQRIGSKGDRSRRRLMDAAFEVLRKKSIWQVTMVDICSVSRTAPSNFYTYFSGVDDVVVALARRVNGEQPAVRPLLEQSWEGRGGLLWARKFVDVTFEYWNRYRPVLKVVELLADEGNPVFDEIRAERFLPIYDAMQPLIVRAQREGRLHRRLDPRIVAISALALVESAAMHAPLTYEYGHAEAALRETQARLLLLHLTGRDSG